MPTIEMLPDNIVRAKAGGKTVVAHVLDFFSDAGDRIARNTFGSDAFDSLICTREYQQLGQEVEVYWSQYESLYYAD